MGVRLAISLGDPRGVGPEVVMKALAAIEVPGLDGVELFGPEEVRVPPYVLDVDEARAREIAAAALEEAAACVRSGRAQALVTAPLPKAALFHLAGGPFMGHTGFLAKRFGGTPLMTFVGGRLRLALLTAHVPLGEVPRMLREIGVSGVVKRLRIFARGLERDLGLAQPRLALLALNPHSGEGGVLGREEIELLAPAVERARDEGIDVEGPFAADGYFARVASGESLHDGVVACGHDLGLVGFKTLHPRDGAQLTMGLEVVRTSPQHGTARDLAGRNSADPSSAVAAIRLACEVAERRLCAAK